MNTPSVFSVIYVPFVCIGYPMRGEVFHTGDKEEPYPHDKDCGVTYFRVEVDHHYQNDAEYCTGGQSENVAKMFWLCFGYKGDSCTEWNRHDRNCQIKCKHVINIAKFGLYCNVN